MIFGHTMKNFPHRKWVVNPTKSCMCSNINSRFCDRKLRASSVVKKLGATMSQSRLTKTKYCFILVQKVLQQCINTIPISPDL